MMDTFGQWLTTAMGTALYKLIDVLIDKVDPKDWLKKYADMLVAKFLAKMEGQDMQGELQKHVLDPIKRWLETKLNINL
jgi:hypothetical protein